MIAYPPSLLAVGGARTGIAPVNLLDVQDVNGNRYFWSDRRIVAPFAIGETSSNMPPALSLPFAPTAGQKTLWLLPTTFLAASGSHTAAGGDLTGGSLDCSYSGIFSDPGTLSWGGFIPPSLPAGAVVDSVYLTGIANQIGSAPSMCTLPLTGAQSTVSIHFADISTATINAWLNATVPIGAISAILTVLNPSIVIYYHFSGGGSTDPFTPDVAPYGWGEYEPWLLTVPELTFHRSSVADLGSFVLQNLSGDTISRDFEKIMRRSALEGAFCIFRSWQKDAQASWIEVHGKLTVEDVGVDTVTLKGEPVINPAQDDTPLEEFAEGCQLQWGQARCGATGTTECQYSFQTCQVIERIMAAPNSFEKNYGEAAANVPTQLINRRRRI
jgi:hypothetical protein